jgi:hypothetical protein
MPPKYTVRRKDLMTGAKIEAKEHPWASPTRARRIARDHLQAEGPGYYRAEPVNEKIIRNINRKMRAKPIRRKPMPRPNPFARFAGYPF